MVQKGPGVLSDSVRSALKLVACKLSQKKLDEMRFQNSIICGIIKTEWKSHMVGTRAGILFKSHIDCEDGEDYQVNFLMSTTDLENGSEAIRQIEEGNDGWWERLSDRIPIQELYQFENLAGLSRRLN